jgi:hypothetical protein
VPKEEKRILKLRLPFETPEEPKKKVTDSSKRTGIELIQHYCMTSVQAILISWISRIQPLSYRF